MTHVSVSKKRRQQAIQAFRSQHKEAETSLLSEEPKKFDPKATTEDLLADLRRVQEDRPDEHITRRKYRKYGRYSDSTWDSKFGTFAEFRKQARLELSRGQQALERQIAKHASLDVRRGFMEQEVLPWNGKYERDNTKRWQTVIAFSDVHDKDADPFVLSVLLDVCKRVQPEIIGMVGDIYDAFEFSRFDKDPRHWDAAGRLSWVRDNLYAPLRSACPEAQIDLLAGNHEHHLLRHMSERTPEMRAILSDFMGLTFADILGLRQFEINLRCQHDLSAFNAKDIRKEIAKNRKTYFECLTLDHYPDKNFTFGTNWIAGHTHKPAFETHCNEVLGGIWGYTNGCIARVDNAYTDRNRNHNSFSIIHIDTHTKKALLEPILFSDDSAIVGGQIYRRLECLKNAG